MDLDDLPVLQKVPELGKEARAVGRATVTTISNGIVDVYVLGIIPVYRTPGTDKQERVLLCARVEHTEVADKCITVNSGQLYTCPVDAIKNYERKERFKKPRRLNYFMPPRPKK